MIRLPSALIEIGELTYGKQTGKNPVLVGAAEAPAFWFGCMFCDGYGDYLRSCNYPRTKYKFSWL